MMRRWSVYDLATGLFTGRRVTCLDQHAKANTPDGCGLIEGVFDRKSQRVDLETGVVVAYERPAAEIEVEQRDVLRRQARQRIDELERAQLRPMRELAIDPNDAEAKLRLAEIDGEIGALRVDLT